jgi:hypothetical protein
MNFALARITGCCTTTNSVKWLHLMHLSYISSFITVIFISVIHLPFVAGQIEVAYVIPVLFLSNSLGTPLLPKTIENQDFEMALSSADNKELLQKWYQLDGHAQPPCYRLQPIASHIPGFKVQNNIYTLNQDKYIQ